MEMPLKWSQVLDGAGDAMVLTDKAGLIFYVNSALERLLGYSRAELEGLSTPELFHDAEELRLYRKLLRPLFGEKVEGFGVFLLALEDCTSSERDWLYVRKDGSRLPVSLAIHKVIDEKGEVCAYMGVARDISKRQPLQHPLGEGEELFRAFFDNAPYGMALIRASDRVHLDVNKAFLEESGYSREEVIGKDIYAFDHLEDPEEMGRMTFLMRSQGFISNYPYRHRTRTGEVRDKLYSLFPLSQGGERVYASISLDVTAQKKAEEEVRLLNSALESKVEERTAELEKSLGELRASQDKLVKAEREASIGRLAAGIAHELNNPLGMIHAAASEGMSLWESDWRPAVDFIAGLDAWERDSLWGLVQQARPEQVTGVTRHRLSAFLASSLGISKELAGILADLCITESSPELRKLLLSPKGPEIIKAAQNLGAFRQLWKISLEAARRARHSLETLNHYLRQEEMLSVGEGLDLCDSIRLVLEELKPRLPDSIRVESSLHGHWRLPARQGPMSLVWKNLVDNALAAMPEGGVLSVGATEAGGEIHIAFGDTGVGIPPGLLDRIFEPFFSTKPKGEGLGLGLDICRRLLAELQGSLTVESRPGLTTFLVTLPVSPSESP